MRFAEAVLASVMLLQETMGLHHGKKYCSQYDRRLANEFDGYYNTLTGIPDYTSYKTGSVVDAGSLVGTHPAYNCVNNYDPYNNHAYNYKHNYPVPRRHGCEYKAYNNLYNSGHTPCYQAKPIPYYNEKSCGYGYGNSYNSCSYNKGCGYGYGYDKSCKSCDYGKKDGYSCGCGYNNCKSCDYHAGYKSGKNCGCGRGGDCDKCLYNKGYHDGKKYDKKGYSSKSNYKSSKNYNHRPKSNYNYKPKNDYSYKPNNHYDNNYGYKDNGYSNNYHKPTGYGYGNNYPKQELNYDYFRVRRDE